MPDKKQTPKEPGEPRRFTEAPPERRGTETDPPKTDPPKNPQHLQPKKTDDQ